MRRLITLLLIGSLIMGLDIPADAQFWKKKSKRHSHKKKHRQHTTASDSTRANDDTYIPEEDDRIEPKETKKTRAQKKKEKQEKKRKEKEDRKKQKDKEKKEKKDRRAKKKHKATAPAATAVPVVSKKWAEIDYPVSMRKTNYRIDLLAPMYLDDLVKNGYTSKSIPEKAQKGLDFYKGAQIAADTLKKALFNIDIYVHDVASFMESADMLIRNNKLDSTDLLLGAIADKDVFPIAEYARKKQVNFVSATSGYDGGIRDNPYFTMMQPSLQSHCEWIVDNLQHTFPKGKVLLLHRTGNVPDDNAFKYLTADPNTKDLYFNLLCNAPPGKEAVQLLIDSGQANIVVVAINDAKYADSLLRGLKTNFPATRFSVYCLPSLAASGYLYRQGAFPGFTFNTAAPFEFDGQSSLVKYIDQVFRKEYGGKPSEMVYRGFETMFWYANMLRNYGVLFNKHYTDNEAAPLNKFEIKPQWDSNGNMLYHENRHLNLRKIEGSAASK